MNSPEAPLLKRMNRLKENVDESLLTPAQIEALEKIIEHRKDGAQFINLHGPRDAGKTFLCWALQQKDEWEYYQALPDDPTSPAVIYDHGSPERRTTRKLRNHVSITGVATVVYVTERPANELYPRVEFRPEDSHYEMVESTWERLGIKCNKKRDLPSQ